ncbi:energy transducer TonB [Pelagicoccus mobilis]|uniref:TonB family protein n=1 Tax=Pelagicoccus mobilis TaxID=415221 RepID=A0A934RR93_9BACT|nr:energy transducer TonB [Pelagicoccus mobilis]MBK1875432.1 TonB family protein [Pelagicoccus mobilis]
MGSIKPFIKFLVFGTIGGGISVGLWILMLNLIESSGFSKKDFEDPGSIEFVRLKRAEPPKFKEREIPQKPPPPKKPPPPPSMTVSDMEKPTNEPMDIDMPNIDLPAAGVGGGAFISNFQGTVAQGDRERLPKFRIEPEYPMKARQEGIEGYVKLMIDITDKGTVTNVRIVEAEPRRYFETAAKRAVLRWKYDPLVVDGVPTADYDISVRLDFTFGDE